MAIKHLLHSANSVYVANGRILRKGLAGVDELGHIFHSKPSLITKDQLSASLGISLKDWKLPARFFYVFVDEIKLQPTYRGKGLGSEVLQAFFSAQRSSTLVALEPGEITKSVKLESLNNFYSKNGMYLKTIEGDRFAFKWIP